MKIKDILFAIKLSLISDKNKMLFMQYLMQLCDDHNEYNDIIKYMSTLKDDRTWYLQELYEYYQINKDIKMKLDRDINIHLSPSDK